jgi:hypothetical protein
MGAIRKRFQWIKAEFREKSAVVAANVHESPVSEISFGVVGVAFLFLIEKQACLVSDGSQSAYRCVWRYWIRGGSSLRQFLVWIP